MDDILQEFAAELREGFADLAPDLAVWRAAPCGGAPHDALFRFIHTAKAGAGFVRMTRIEALADAA